MDDRQTLLILGRLLPYTYTKNQAIKRLRLIKKYLNFKFFEIQGITDEKKALAEFRKSYLKEVALSDAKEISFFETLGEAFFKLFVPQTLHLQIEDLEKEILKSKIVTLHIPFEIPNDEVQELGVWFKQNLGATTLYDMVFDPTLIGGCAISYNGQYRDYSIKQKIKGNHDAILKLLTNFRNKS